MNDDDAMAQLTELHESGLAVDFRSPEEIEAAWLELNRSWTQKLWSAIKRWWARWRYRGQEFTLAELDAAQGPPGSIQTAGEIAKALKDLQSRRGNQFVNPEHTELFPWADPGRYTPGYDKERGVTVHPDSVVIRPYVGSTAEEEAQRPILPKPQPDKKRFGKYTCVHCFGVGKWFGRDDQLVSCSYCKGKGWR